MSDAPISTGGLVRVFRRGPWEVAAMALIAAGIIMLVQPWSIDLYGYSFVTILVGTLGYVAVSHFPE
jgi:drug/metabolite transporter (DMT)-like permease